MPVVFVKSTDRTSPASVILTLMHSVPAGLAISALNLKYCEGLGVTVQHSTVLKCPTRAV